MFGQGVEKRIGTDESGVNGDFPKLDANIFSGFFNGNINQRENIKGRTRLIWLSEIQNILT